MPKTVKRIAVLDRTKEAGANGEPLYLDVRDVYYNMADKPLIVGGRYGLGSKEFYPGDAWLSSTTSRRLNRKTTSPLVSLMM